MPVCPRCGRYSPEGFRFCGECAAPLAEQVRPVREERKFVTAVFIDIVNSTARAERLDPEDVRALLAPYYARVRNELERFGGAVEKFIGDAVVALFGAPLTHEDDPERAVRAALAIRAAVARLNVENPWLNLQIRTGITTGEALVVVDARGSAAQGLATGDVTNTAARLQSGAPIGGILVDEPTQRATAHAVEYQVARPVSAKGKARPIPSWVVVAAKGRPARRATSMTRLVGREAELNRLRELWEGVRTDGRAAAAVVVGPPGIGKSRLLVEFSDSARAVGSVNWGRCLAYGEGITYWPITEALKSAAGILQSDDPVAVPDKVARLLEVLGRRGPDEVRTMTAALAHVMGVTASPDRSIDDSEITQAELHWGIRQVLRLLAARKPLLLVVEDLHWAEPTLVDLIGHIADAGFQAPILVLASARTDLSEPLRRSGVATTGW